MGETPVPSPAASSDASTEDCQQPKGSEGKWRIGGRLAWLVGWGTKGGLALTDQASFAGAQFVLNILLARWLPPAEYGAFAVAYSVFVLATGVHGALLIEPMIIFGSGRHFKNRKNYLGIAIRGHWLLVVPVGLILFGIGFVVGRMYSRPLGHALCAMGLALPLMLFAWLTRRAFYIELQPGRAAAGSVIYFSGLIALVLGLRSARMLSPAAAIVAMGAAALLAAGLQLIWLRPQWTRVPGGLTLGRLASEHWGYGRWILASVLPTWILLNVYYLALPAWFGLKTAGILKALMNLAMPASHSLIAFGVLALPVLVRHRNEGGLAVMQKTVRLIAALFLFGATVYFVVLWLFRIQIFQLLYGGKYMEYSGLPVLLVGLVPFATACGVAVGGALRACERPDIVFRGYLVGSALTLSVGLWLAASRGVVGALMGYLVSYVALAGAFWFLYRRLSGRVATT